MESKLEDLRDELDKKDNNPNESMRIKKEISDLVKNINNLKIYLFDFIQRLAKIIILFSSVIRWVYSFI